MVNNYIFIHTKCLSISSIVILILFILVNIGIYIANYKYKKQDQIKYKIKHKRCDVCQYFDKNFICPDTYECFSTVECTPEPTASPCKKDKLDLDEIYGS